MPPRRPWTREELIITLSLYFQLPFGRLNHTTKEVRDLAKLIGRTDNSIALRLVNFAACDPYILSTGRHGMASGVGVCQPIWDEFANDKERLFYEAEQIRAHYMGLQLEYLLTTRQQTELSQYAGEDRKAYIKTRVNQNIFRTTILENYEHKCAITGIDIPELLIASHIIPWAEKVETRLDPANGICLSALYDKAFDKGLIGINKDYTIILSSRLKEQEGKEYYQSNFAPIDHLKLTLPIEHCPDPSYLEYHLDTIFEH